PAPTHPTLTDQPHHVLAGALDRPPVVLLRRDQLDVLAQDQQKLHDALLNGPETRPSTRTTPPVPRLRQPRTFAVNRSGRLGDVADRVTGRACGPRACHVRRSVGDLRRGTSRSGRLGAGSATGRRRCSPWAAGASCRSAGCCPGSACTCPTDWSSPARSPSPSWRSNLGPDG